MNIEREKENFKDHVAKFTDYGDVKILDFKNPESENYHIRFLFEEDLCKLHISGDLGELTATNQYNMTYEKFGDFVRNPGYFKEKIDCMSRRIYKYNEAKARRDLLKLIEEEELEEAFMEDRYESETIEDVIDDILVDFSQDTGIGPSGLEELEGGISDAWEDAEYIGRESTGIIDLYMLAFQLAKEQLKEQEKTKMSQQFCAPYGSIDSRYVGVITDLNTLPDNTLFYVANGGWWGFIQHNEDGSKRLYTEVNKDNPTKEYTRVMVINTTYDAVISHVSTMEQRDTEFDDLKQSEDLELE